MTNRIEVLIPGEPIPQHRTQSTVVTDRAGNVVRNRKTKRPLIRNYTPDSRRKDGSGSLVGWKDAVIIKVREQAPAEPWDGPVELDVTFWFDRTQELEKKKHADGELLHAVKPDLDNLVKAIKDVMTEARVWVDDGRVCDTVIRKRYVARGHGPGCRVIARLITPDTESLYA